MGIDKNFIVRHGLEVGENLIYANKDTQKVGIGTTAPEYTADIKGDLAFTGQLLTVPKINTPGSVSGIANAATPQFITGINTSNIRVYDLIDDGVGGVIETGTKVIAIGINNIQIDPIHTRTSGSGSVNLTITRSLYSGIEEDVLISRGPGLPPMWKTPTGETVIATSSTSSVSYPIFASGAGSTIVNINTNRLSFIPSSGNFGINTTNPKVSLDVIGNANFTGVATATSLNVTGVATAASLNITEVATATSLNVTGVATVGFLTATNASVAQTFTANTVDALTYFGSGEALSGIVTQITAGIGVRLSSTEFPGKGVVKVDSYFPIGKTIFVTQNGSDSNSGLTESDSKKTIKAAAAIAFPGDTIKVFPGVYVEENPIYLSKRVSVEGTELRNCVVTAKYVDRDLFYVNNSCHITDLSFIGPAMTNGAAIVALQPLLGVSADRYFDAARMIRYNLDYIAKESVGFLTSGFSGFAGNHREQDAARLIDLNINFIAAEAIGFITSTDYNNPPFTIVNSSGIATDPVNCSDDIKDILRSISYDLKAKSNKKVIGAGLSYYDNGGTLLHITGTDTNGYSVKDATIAAINHAVGIATYVINNIPYSGTKYSGLTQDTSSYSPVIVSGGCSDTITRIESLSNVVTSILDNFNNAAGITTVYGVNLESNDCADDIKDVWKCVIHDITRGGNSRCVAAGKSYYDEDWNLIPQILKNPGEVDQSVATLDYSFDVARAIINNVSWGGFPVGLATAVTSATYNNITGIATITAINHGLAKDNAVKIVGLGFTCPSGPGVLTYPSGNLGYIFNVKSVVGVNTFEVIVGQSTLPHTYVSDGTVQKYTNFQNNITQVKDLGMQIDPDTGFNNGIDGCANVVSAMRSCIGVVTSIIGYGSTSGITTSYPANSGVGTTSVIGVTSAVYDNTSGETKILAPTLSVKPGDIVEVRDLLFNCTSGGSIGTQRYPSGAYGYEFDVTSVNSDGSFIINTGVSTISHNYVGGGFVVNRAIGVTTASYNNVTGITTITAPGAVVKVGQFVKLHNLKFSCTSGAGTTTLYPTGNLGYEFRVIDVIGTGTTFVVNTGISTIPHSYVSGGVVFPPYSPGVGPITQGPYVRNCTNFVAGSIGMKVDGFEAEPGDQDDIGITGTMSVDSYTQYNQGGIGVSITNGAYAQLVSIFTICDDIAIFTGSGGQCDITNSNSSFGRLGLVADGVGNYDTKSIYHHTGSVNAQAAAEQAVIEVSNIGSLRPYDGQTLHFGELYYNVQSITVTNGGFGYTQAPKVTVDFPTGPSGIRAEAIASIDSTGRVSSIDIISTGSQYKPSDNPQITIAGPTGVGVTATASLNLYPIYYTIESATLPNAGISTVTLNTNLNNTVSAGTTVYFNRLSLQIVSSHSFEWVGSGNNINTAKPSLGGVVVQEAEVVKLNGGEIVYTSTDQAGNFRIGDDFVVNQLTGTISGRAVQQSIITTVTPLIVALGK